MDNSEEWITTEELARLTGYCDSVLREFSKHRIIPNDKTKLERINGSKNRIKLFHRSLIEELAKRRKNWQGLQGMKAPEGAIKYDGFELTPDMIRRLEAVRNGNGYRAIHWTDKTVEQLIAEGGDAEEWKS